MLNLDSTFSESEMGKTLPRGSVCSLPTGLPAEVISNTHLKLSSDKPNKENLPSTLYQTDCRQLNGATRSEEVD